jgi:hypothetical protein
VAFGMPMGPLELMDLVGVDVAGHVSQNMYPPTATAGPGAGVGNSAKAREKSPVRASCSRPNSDASDSAARLSDRWPRSGKHLRE